jgi:molecular chaperone DnaK
MNTSSEPADLGIDLGTSNCVIAIKGRVDLDPSYPQARYIEECDTTIIPTPDGHPTFPSVFWVDPEDPNRIIIGTEAKQQAETGSAPIMFSKRSIGTKEPLTLHDRTYTAKEVATHILRHLKQCAERALGRPVRRAVITYPAWFGPIQTQETREAAIAAGFNMDDPRQMMMEPAAAALAYTHSVQEGPITIVTYDLGGATFDVTVLQRKQGVTRVLSFDGDHLLGGYNFDRVLVQWILRKLREKGHVISYDETNPEDRARHARLLQLAEEVKMRLSAHPNLPAREPDIGGEKYGSCAHHCSRRCASRRVSLLFRRQNRNAERTAARSGR